MSFDRPLLLLTVLVIPVTALLYMLAQRRRMRYALTFTNLDVLAAVVAGGRPWRRHVPPLLFLLALAALCVASARPHRKTLVPSERATVILVIDVSGSMEAKDIKPTRLAAAQAAARTFLNRVPEKVRVGLIAFAANPEEAAPPTTERVLLREAVDGLGLFSGYSGTAIGDALQAAVDLGARSQSDLAAATWEPSDAVSILFLSDGHQTAGALQPLEGAALAEKAGIRVYTVALGTPNGVLRRPRGGFGGFPGGPGPRVIAVPPDPSTLRLIARTTGGEFFDARSADALESAYKNLGSRLGRVPANIEITYVFVAAAAALLVAASVLSALWSPRLP